MDQLQEEHAAGCGPPRKVEVVGLEGGLDFDERGVVGLDVDAVLVDEALPGPLDQADQAEPGLGVAQGVVGGEHAVDHGPVCVVPWEKGLEEGPAVGVLEAEHSALDEQGGKVLLVHVVLVCCLQHAQEQAPVVHFPLEGPAYIRQGPRPWLPRRAFLCIIMPSKESA